MILRRRLTAAALIATAALLAFSEELSTARASECVVSGSDLDGDTQYALFIAVARLPDGLAGPSYDALHPFTVGQQGKAAIIGNAFLIARNGTAGLIVTAKHVASEICSGLNGNTDKTVYLGWPGLGTVDKLVPTQLATPVSCSQATGDPVLGTDIAFLNVDLSQFAGGVAQFKPLPIASKFWDKTPASNFDELTVEGYEPDQQFQRITAQWANGNRYLNYKGVFVIANSFSPGYSGSAIVGRKNGHYAVVGVATNQFPYTPGQGGPVSLDAVPFLIDDKIASQVGPAGRGLGLDLGYLSQSLPNLMQDSDVKQIITLADTPLRSDQKQELDVLASKLSDPIDPAILVKYYSDLRSSSNAPAPGKYLVFYQRMEMAELSWCWNPRSFDDFASKDAAAFAQSGVSGRNAVVAQAQNLLAQTNSGISNPNNAARTLAVAYSQLSVLAPTACTTANPSACGSSAGGLTAQVIKDRQTAAIRLVMTSPNDQNLAILNKEFAPGAPVNVGDIGLEKSAADARVQAAKSIPDPTEKKNLLDTALATYHQIISSGGVANQLLQQTKASQAYAVTLSAGP